MTDINTVTMTGNLTKDVEVRNNVAKMSIAVNRSVKDQNGNWADVASYFDWIKFLSQNADTSKMQQKLTKGTPVTFSGEARQNKWQDQEGKTCYSISFIVSNMKINARPQATPAPSQQNYGSYQNQEYKPVNNGPEEFENCPF